MEGQNGLFCTQVRFDFPSPLAQVSQTQTAIKTAEATEDGEISWCRGEDVIFLKEKGEE